MVATEVTEIDTPSECSVVSVAIPYIHLQTDLVQWSQFVTVSFDLRRRPLLRDDFLFQRIHCFDRFANVWRFAVLIRHLHLTPGGEMQIIVFQGQGMHRRCLFGHRRRKPG